MLNITLTIDDIASKNTPAIVDYLNSKGIPAVMFAVGENVEKYYDEAIYALKNGMIVGNHSYSHPAFSKLSLEDGIADFEKNEAVLDKLYKDAGVERKYRPVRFPFGDKGGANKDGYQEYFVRNGYTKLDDRKITYPWWHETGLDKDIDTLWTYDFEEYRVRPESGFTFDDVLKKMDVTNPVQGGALYDENSHQMLLLHAHDETDEMAPKYYQILIEKLLEHGAVFSVNFK